MSISQTEKLGEWGDYKYGKTITILSRLLPYKIKKILDKDITKS